MKALVALCCFIVLNAQAETISAKVIVVIDGDTVMVLRESGNKAAGHPPASPLRGGQKVKVRLANIDAPEKDQEFGKQSSESLKEMVGRKHVQIDIQAIDQYGRSVGLISVDGINVNQEQVRRGMAWEYSHYHADRTYIALQSDAQLARRGLWAQTSPLAPWQWRKQHPSNISVAQIKQHGTSRLSAPVVLYDMECGKKSRCSQMISCDEAYFYFNHCGDKTLDGNRDGAPCESLCGGRK